MPEQKSKEAVRVEPTKAPAPFEEMERWFEDYFRRPFSQTRPSWFPRLRIPEIEEISPSVDVLKKEMG